MTRHTGEAGNLNRNPAFAPEAAIRLTYQEQQVLELIMLGLTDRAIGERLHLSVNTIKWYVRRLLQKFAAENRTQLTARALQKEL